MSDVGACHFCGKECPRYQTHCDWKCMVETAKKNGGKVHAPNGLPVRSIDRDGNMWEHEHGDHPDYMFPVEVEYVGDDATEEFAVVNNLGERVDMGPDWLEQVKVQEHALIYTDGSVALTLYECCFAMWSIKDAWCMGGSLWKKGTYYEEYHTGKGWRLTQKSIERIKARQYAM